MAALATGMIVTGCASQGLSQTQAAAPIERPGQPARQAGPEISPERSDQMTAPERSANAFASSDAARGAARTHTVSSGENLFRIALNNGMTTQQLAALNDIPAPYVIVPGQALRLDAASTSAPAQPAARRSSAAPAEVRLASAPSPQSARQIPAVSSRGTPDFILPVDGRLVSRSRSLHSGGSAPGWTFAVASGAPVSAAAQGSVMYAGDGVPGFGNLVLIRHSGDWVTAYGHNDRILVSRGDSVTVGQTIARAPRVRRSEQAEVYFEVRNGVTPVDPGQVIEPGMARAGDRFADASR
jgi:lipoprotein NlpD